ncbi:MBL fold metallo-hydrolase [Paucibacter soli]|uniref:MBL fold metallo-hydrolase n=1 Tax=Paucibacter soli TaxID=3133433 RepID=UPI0030A6D933
MLLRHLLVLSLMLCTAAQAATPQALDDDEGVFWLPGSHVAGAQPDGNSVLLRGAQGWVLVDSGRHAAHTQALLDFFMRGREKGGKELALINSHWHLDHLGGNALIRQQWPGLRVYASAAVEGALQGWLSDYRKQLEGLIEKPQDLDEDSLRSVRIDLALLQQAEALRPDQILDGAQQDLTLAGRKLRLGVIKGAVSGGDVWVLDLASQTLVAGDLVTMPVPFLDTACASGWATALQTLADQPFTRLVPGHGPVLSRQEFQHYRESYGRLLQCAASAQEPTACADQWLRDAAAWIAPAEQPRARAMLGYYFSQHLRAPTRERFCNASP